MARRTGGASWGLGFFAKGTSAAFIVVCYLLKERKTNWNRKGLFPLSACILHVHPKVVIDEDAIELHATRSSCDVNLRNRPRSDLDRLRDSIYPDLQSPYGPAYIVEIDEKH